MHALEISSQPSCMSHLTCSCFLLPDSVSRAIAIAITSLLPAINVAYLSPFPCRFLMVTSRHNCPIAGAPFPAVAAATFAMAGGPSRPSSSSSPDRLLLPAAVTVKSAVVWYSETVYGHTFRNSASRLLGLPPWRVPAASGFVDHQPAAQPDRTGPRTNTSRQARPDPKWSAPTKCARVAVISSSISVSFIQDAGTTHYGENLEPVFGTR